MSKAKDTKASESKDPLENIGIMKQGDYMIHVFVEAGKSFVLDAN